MNKLLCGSCDSRNIECFDCMMDPNECDCMRDPNVKYVVYECHDCNAVSEVIVDDYMDGEDQCVLTYIDAAEYWQTITEIEYGDEPDFEIEPPADNDKPKSKSKAPTKDLGYYMDDEGYEWSLSFKDNEVWRSRPSFYSKCRHYSHPVEFPSGVTVYPSSMLDREPEDWRPDFALYLDMGWRPMGMANFIDWQDYGLPYDYYSACISIIDAYKKAADGLWVEVGCIGGHGRTGTALACMAVLGGVDADKAVAWVREAYCDHAVETKDQEWFVLFFDAFVNGGEITLPTKVHDKETKKSNTVPGETYNLDGFDWMDTDLLMSNALGQPPEHMREPSAYLHYEKFNTTKKEQVPTDDVMEVLDVRYGESITKNGASNGDSDDQQEQLPF